jgi:hypothetical protein
LCVKGVRVRVRADAEVDGVDRLERDKSIKRRPVYFFEYWFDREGCENVQVHLEIHTLEGW